MLCWLVVIVVRRERFLFWIAGLAICISIIPFVFAEDGDPSGAISVELTRLDDGFSALTLVFLGILILAALLASVALLVRRRQAVGRMVGGQKKGCPSVSVSDASGDGFRKEGYYGRVLGRSSPDTVVCDEKARHVSFIMKKEAAGDGGVDRYLKEDERIVINVLRMKHNSCSQATLKVVTDFSKARLSRILSELEERGVIFKQPAGRKNMITLKT